MRKLMRKLNNLEPKILDTMKKRPISLLQDFCSRPNPSSLVMPKPIRFISPLLLSTFFLLFFACGKEEPSPTVINGKVTDKKSGLPIEGASVIIDFTTEKSVNGSIKIEHETVTLSTDAQGEFQYTHDAYYTGMYSEVRKEDYVPRTHLKIRRSEVNNLEIELVPKDGTLRLEISNENGQKDSIYVIIENPSFLLEIGPLGEIYLDTFPLILAVGEKYVEYHDLPAEEFTKIHWGHDYFASSSTSPFQDSVLLILQDTTTYKLTY